MWEKATVEEKKAHILGPFEEKIPIDSQFKEAELETVLTKYV